MNKNTFISGQCEITINNSRKDTIKNELTEGTLLNSVQNFRTIYNSVNDAIFIHDIDGNILDVNDKMLEMFAVRREEVKKLSIINDTSHSSNPTEILPEIWEEVVAGENQSFEWKGRRPHDGSIFDLEVFLCPLDLEDNKGAFGKRIPHSSVN